MNTALMWIYRTLGKIKQKLPNLCPVFAWYSKDAFDTRRVSDHDLNVGLFVESRSWINRVALCENALQSIEWRQPLFLKDAVKPADHGAVEIPPQS